MSNIVFCFRDLEGVFVFLDLIDVPHLSCNFYPAMMLHKTKVTEALNSNKVVVLKFIYFSFVPLCSVFPRCPAPVKEGTIRKRSHGAGWQFLGQRVCFNAFIQLSCLSRRLCWMSQSEITPEVFTSGSTIIWRSPLLKVWTQNSFKSFKKLKRKS